MKPSDQRPDGGARPTKNFAGGADRYQALLEVLDEQARRDAADRVLRKKRPTERGPLVRVILAVVLVSLSIWLWFFPPAWLSGVALPPPSLVEEEASLRSVMYLQAQRIRAHRLRSGRLPATLEETGPPMAGMTYRRLGDDLFELTGSTDRVRLTYRSDQPLDAFVGLAGTPQESTPPR